MLSAGFLASALTAAGAAQPSPYGENAGAHRSNGWAPTAFGAFPPAMNGMLAGDLDQDGDLDVLGLGVDGVFVCTNQGNPRHFVQGPAKPVAGLTAYERYARTATLLNLPGSPTPVLVSFLSQETRVFGILSGQEGPRFYQIPASPLVSAVAPLLAPDQGAVIQGQLLALRAETNGITRILGVSLLEDGPHTRLRLRLRGVDASGTPSGPMEEPVNLPVADMIPGVSSCWLESAMVLDQNDDAREDLLLMLTPGNTGSVTAQALVLRGRDTAAGTGFTAAPADRWLLPASDLPSFPGQDWTGSSADFDADGRADILTRHGILRRKPGDVAWRPAPGFQLGTKPGALTIPAIGDLDGDGLLDLVFTTRAGTLDNGSMVWMRNRGSLTTPVWEEPSVLFTFPTIAGNLPSPFLAQFGGDDRVDILLQYDGAARVYVQNGPGHFTLDANNPYALSPAVAAASPLSAWGDVNADGRVDLISVPSLATNVAFHLNTGIPAAPLPAAPDDVLDELNALHPSGIFGPVSVVADPLDAGTRLVMQIRTALAGPRETYSLRLDPHTLNLASGPELVLPDYTDSGSSIAAGSLHGTPDPDLVASFSGDLRMYSPANAIGTADTVSVAPGARLPLALDPAAETVVALRAASGGAAGAGNEYTAGPNQGVDVLEIRGPAGPRRVYVNVRPAPAAGGGGRALLVAGGKSVQDPVWTATDRMVRHARGVLELRGMPREHMRVLSFGHDRETDSHSDGPATRTALDAAFAALASSPEPLLVYLADHGSAGSTNAHLRLNDSELLSATDLRGLLDAHQADTRGDVTVVLDFCQAGAFLPLLANPDFTNRVLIASCGPDEPAHFIARGLVSFSDILFNRLLAGGDLRPAFLTARAAMSGYQLAVMDANADGGDDDRAGGAPPAMAPVFGGAITGGRDVPRIADVSPSRAVAGNDPVLIWAEGVTGPHAVTRVWAVVIPPDGAPASADDPVLDLPEIELPFNPDSNRHEAELRGLHQAGPHRVRVFARDAWGGVSHPREFLLDQGGFTEKAVLVHTGPADGAAAAITAEAYGVLRARRFSPDRIRVLGAGPRELDDAPGNDVHGPATAAALAEAVTAWAADAGQLTVWLVGDADTNGWFQLDVPLAPAALDGWLDLHQGADTSRIQVVVLDGDGTGAAVPALTPPAGARRVVLASAAAGRRAVLAPGASFSSFLLAGIGTGRSVGEAAASARVAIRRYSGNLRQKLIAEDDGDGVPNEKNVDLAFAATLRLGAAFLTGDDRPHIGAVSPAVDDHPAGQPFALFADQVTDADGIAEVWCEVTAPTNTLGNLTTRVALTAAGPARWEGTFPAPTPAGRYSLTYMTRDVRGHLSAPVQSEFSVIAAHQPPRAPPGQPDPHEPDDEASGAGAADIPVKRFHTLHHAGDSDWIRFFVPASTVVDIETIPLSASLDTRLEIYHLRQGDEPELVEFVDEYGAGSGELAGLTFAPPGFYLARVRSGAEPGGFTPGEYQLQVHVPAGLPGGVLVMAYDMTAEVFINGLITLENLTGGVTTSKWTGGAFAWFDTPAGQYRVRSSTELGGYEPDYDLIRADGVPGNPNSFFGNPRLFGMDQFMRLQPGWSVESGAQDSTIITFPFKPFASITGETRGLHGEAVTGVRLRLTGTPGGEVYDRHPWTGYGDPWITGAGGHFPEKLRVPPGRPFRLELDAPGYAPRQTNVPALLRGQVLNLGALSLTALDANANGIPDPWEFEHFNALVSAMADPDGDGCSNAAEYTAGTDPRNAGSVLRFTTEATPGGAFRLRWMAAPQRAYRILAAESLGAEWTQVDLVPAVSSPGERDWTEPAPAGGSRYFRIEPVAP